MVFQDVRKGIWGNKNVRHKYFVTSYNKTWTLEVTWKRSQNKETYTKWAKDNKLDRIRKEAHFFLLETITRQTPLP